jgi:uncharacterized protein (TIRG00374 family)
MTELETSENEKQSISWTRLAAGVIFSALALWVILRNVDLEQTLAAWQEMDLRYFPPALLLFFGTVIARSFAWRTILGDKISVSKAFFTENEGYFLNNVLPFRLGEVGRAIILNLTTKLSFWEVFSTIIVERIFDMGIMAGLLLSTLVFISGAEWALNAALLVGGLVVVGFFVLFLIARNPEWVENFYNRVTARWPRLQQWGNEKITLFLQGLQTLRQPKRFGLVVLLMLVTWLFNISWYWVLLKAFVPEAKFLWAAFSVAVGSLGVAVPSTPGYIGVFEFATVTALGLFSISESDAFAYALVSHALYLVVTVLLGLVGFSRESISVRDVFRRARTAPANPDLSDSD